MEMAEHREPYEPRGSRTVLGERGGEIPPRHSTQAVYICDIKLGLLYPLKAEAQRINISCC
jgi:hypothetical protein